MEINIIIWLQKRGLKFTSCPSLCKSHCVRFIYYNICKTHDRKIDLKDVYLPHSSYSWIFKVIYSISFIQHRIHIHPVNIPTFALTDMTTLHNFVQFILNFLIQNIFWTNIWFPYSDTMNLNEYIWCVCNLSLKYHTLYGHWNIVRVWWIS